MTTHKISDKSYNSALNLTERHMDEKHTLLKENEKLRKILHDTAKTLKIMSNNYAIGFTHGHAVILQKKY
jgi:hypothetical protein